MIISGLEAKKSFKDPLLCLQTQKTGLYSYIMLLCIVPYDVSITIWPLDRSIIAEFTKGFSIGHENATYEHPLFVNNSNHNHYFINYSTYNISFSTNDHPNS